MDDGHVSQEEHGGEQEKMVDLIFRPADDWKDGRTGQLLRLHRSPVASPLIERGF